MIDDSINNGCRQIKFGSLWVLKDEINAYSLRSVNTKFICSEQNYITVSDFLVLKILVEAGLRETIIKIIGKSVVIIEPKSMVDVYIYLKG